MLQRNSCYNVTMTDRMLKSRKLAAVRRYSEDNGITLHEDLLVAVFPNGDTAYLRWNGEKWETVTIT